MARTSDRRGTFVLVVGPSGVGKDSLIAWCRDRLAGDPAIVFPRRFITRPADGGTEDHHSISAVEFAKRAALGAFALSWHAHGLSYGIPATIADDLAGGRSVVANVSRAVIGEARAKFTPACVVSVTADPVLLAERIRRRGRESGEGIDRRLARGEEYAVAGPDVIPLDNSGNLATAGEALLAILQRMSAG